MQEVDVTLENIKILDLKGVIRHINHLIIIIIRNIYGKRKSKMVQL
jgi:hypothetical protein